MVKNPPANVGDTSFGYLGGEESLEKEMATHSGILAWEIPWTEKPGVKKNSWCQKRVRCNLVTKQQDLDSRTDYT